MFLFCETADTMAWHPGEAKPTIMWCTLGGLKLKDLGILGAALPSGAILRVVGDMPLDMAELRAYCAKHGLMVVSTSEDRALTICGCYAHYYADIRHQPLQSLPEHT